MRVEADDQRLRKHDLGFMRVSRGSLLISCNVLDSKKISRFA